MNKLSDQDKEIYTAMMQQAFKPASKTALDEALDRADHVQELLDRSEDGSDLSQAKVRRLSSK